MSRSDLWSPQMQKWIADAPAHGVHFMIADKPMRRYKPGGESGNSSGGGQPGGSTQGALLWQSGGNPILWLAGDNSLLVGN